jgi:hypothetical protein
METQNQEELFNDTFTTSKWYEHCKRIFGDAQTRKHHMVPGLRVPIFPETYKTVIIRLKEELGKKQRKALRYAKNLGHSAFRVDWKEAMKEAVAHGKPIQSPEEYYQSLDKMGSYFYLCKGPDGKIIGGLTVIHGEKWITECIAFGEQDAIKGQVIDDHKKDYDYYDLAGVNTEENSPAWKVWRDKEKESQINRYKLKWGDIVEVRLK